MSEELVGLLVLAGLCTASAVAFHGWTRRFGWACLASALVAATLFVAVDAVRSGYLDPFFPVAWVAALLCGLVVSAAVGALLRALRGRGRRAGPSARPR